MDFKKKCASYFKPPRLSFDGKDGFKQKNNWYDDRIEYTSLSKSSRCIDIDEIMQENAAYEYLCRLEEAKLWMQECIQESLPRSTELEAQLRNGVYLAKLVNFIAPHVVPLKKIFDIEQLVYRKSGLHYRHTDNINYWILSMKAVGLPSYFYPNSFDVYGKKNMPKAVYCLHALSLYLHRCGKGMKIIDLIGKIQFSAEEIHSVSVEFQKFGIQLPAFSKIGGILSHEIIPGDAIMHAAIIAINIAICQKNSEHLLAALLNPNAHLENIVEENAEMYQSALLQLKFKTVSNSRRKYSNTKSELYWDFLTHRMIQEEMDTVNTIAILNVVKNTAVHGRVNDFISNLRDPLLNISDIAIENGNAYIASFKDVLHNANIDSLGISEIQSLVLTVNFNEFKNTEIKSALINFNNILDSDNYFASYNILKSLVTEIDLHDLGRQFYHFQLRNLKELKGEFLDFHDIKEHLPKLTALLDVNMALIQSNVDDTYQTLSNSIIKCWDLKINLKTDYFNELKLLMLKKGVDFLSTEQIKDCITNINTTVELKEKASTPFKKINIAISMNNENLLINSLLEDSSLLCVNPKHKNFYLNLLKEYKLTNTEPDELCQEEIQKQINLANKLVLEAEYFCACLASINMAVDKKDCDILFNSLKAFCKDKILCLRCKTIYLSKLIDIKIMNHDKYLSDKDATYLSWIRWEVSTQAVFYLNLKTLETAWNREDSVTSLFLNKEEIFQVIAEVETECQCLKYQVLEGFIVSIQSHIRGFLLRQNLSRRKLPVINYTPHHEKAVLKLQSFVRMSLVRKKYMKQKAEKMRLHAAARVIQRKWRSFKINQNLNLLAHSSNPPLPLMQKIIYMLEISNDDYSEEFRLHTLKGKVVQSIRNNQSLLKEIDETDLKIGLLIRNRITLEDLLKQKKKANVKAKKTEPPERPQNNQNFKLYSKKYHKLIESYQNLLYLLQTEPVYLSHLIISLPSNQATSLIESFIFSLYNFGSTPREEYLLLKMLSLTLEEDIKQKGDNLSDIIKGENIIMKIIISFYRRNYWHDCLKKLLQPLVSEVLNDKTSKCSMDPVEIYKVWQNELEMQTGEKSTMPYEVTVEEALSYPEVNDHFNHCVDQLLQYSVKFCEVIVSSQSLIPYGMMYISKVLKTSLQKKYPTSSNEELHKIVGNLLYYRYINPTIIAPDVFDIIPTQFNEQLADSDRLKLSAVAKFLHLSVTGKEYTEETGHLMCLNPYIRNCHEILMTFFEEICKVKSLEEHFNIDFFSEAIVKIPEVYMSLNELQVLYKLIKEREYDLAPDPNDISHEIIEDISLNSIENVYDSTNDFLNTEMCLSLRSKYDLEVEDETDGEKMYVETKFMLITLLQILANVNDVTDLFIREPTVEEEMFYMKSAGSDFSHTWVKTSRNWKTLSALQSAVQFNLNSLELSGYVTSSNNYQEILNDIAKDIVNRWRYRISRKKDILKLIEIQKQLDGKTLFYLEKLDCYNEYIGACLENMKIGRQNKKFFCKNMSSRELKCKRTIKCSGSKLHEKGILLEIKDLDTCQLKNVIFEISPTEDLGIFTVNVKFMGILSETVDIDIQELLDQQYQGTAEINMFECVKINNNLLLHFLNSKFYGKSLS